MVQRLGAGLWLLGLVLYGCRSQGAPAGTRSLTLAPPKLELGVLVENETARAGVELTNPGATLRLRPAASSARCRWQGLPETGKPILADTGYGANGMSAGHDPNWDVVANINARIADGVTSIAQYNPNSSWGTTISGIRSQLNKPKSCP